MWGKGLIQWVSSSHQAAKVLELQLQHQSFQWIFRVDFLYNWLVWSPCCPRDSQESSPAPQFESINILVLGLLMSQVLYLYMTTEKTMALTIWTFVGKVMSLLFNMLARKDWCQSWNSNTLATSCEELTHWKRPWCWEGLGTGGEGDNRGWDGWMASPTRWAWVWVNSGSWWWTGRPGVLRFMGSQRVIHNWVTELNWTEVGHNFPSRSKKLNFMAAVTIHSDFGAQENKICHCFHLPPFHLAWSDGTGCHDLSFLNGEKDVIISLDKENLWYYFALIHYFKNSPSKLIMERGSVALIRCV